MRRDICFYFDGGVCCHPTLEMGEVSEQTCDKCGEYMLDEYEQDCEQDIDEKER